MKNKTQNISPPSGITATDKISLSVPGKNVLPEIIPLVFIAFCGCFALMNAFVSMFDIDISAFTLNFYTIFFFVIFSVIFMLPPKATLSLIPILCGYSLLLYRNFRSFKRGFMLVCNQAHDVIFPNEEPLYPLKISKFKIDDEISVFMGFSIFLLVLLICYFTIVKPSFPVCFFASFMIVEVGLYYGKMPKLIYMIILLLYWVAVLTLDISDYYRHSHKTGTGFIRKGNVFTAKPSVRFKTAGQSAIAVLTGAVFIIAISHSVINHADFSRPEKVNEMRSNVKTAINDFSFDNFGESFQRLTASFKFGHIPSMRHRIGNLSSVSFDGRTMLTLTFSDSSYKPEGNMYLKGYVGSVYDGKSWTLLDDSIYKDNAELFEKMNKLRRMPQDMLTHNYEQYYAAENNPYSFLGSSDTSYDYTKMKIDYKFLNPDYLYVPYNSIAPSQAEYKDDTTYTLENMNTYYFRVSDIQDFDVIYTFSGYDNYYYNEFVHENYLSYPDNNEMQSLYDTYIDGNFHEDLFSQLEYIKSILAENAEYTLSPGRTPSDKDFVSYFLNENHKGYCVHFATAGVILARMSGIPARYAEGYVALEEDFNYENSADGSMKINIDDNRAHAWAEIYIDDMGWIPYEFTPPAAADVMKENIGNKEKTTTVKANTTPLKRTTITKTTAKKSSTNTSKTSTNTPATAVNGGYSAPKSTTDTEKPLSPETKLVIGTVIMLILITLFIALRHNYMVKQRRLKLHSPNYNEAVIYAYKYIQKLLNELEIDIGNMHYLEFAAYAEENAESFIENGEFNEITQIALEAEHSTHQISRSQAKKTIDFAVKLSEKIYSQKNIAQKFTMKFLKNL